MSTDTETTTPPSAVESDGPTGGEMGEILEAEWGDIRARRKELFGVDDAGRPEGMTGLALSGGGIRSATFNLGILEALAKHGVLKHVDYISTVSGGGYIGSCLSSILNGKHEGAGERASIEWGERFPFFHTPGEVEPGAARHLRNYSNYLCPDGRLADQVRIPALLVRGVVVNLSVLLPWIILSSFFIAGIYGTAITSADSVWAFFRITPWAIALAAVAALVSPLVQGGSWSERDFKRRVWSYVVMAPVVIFLFESLPALSFVMYDPETSTDLASHVRALGAALVSILPVVLAGKAAEKVSAVGGKIGIVVIGLLGPAALVYLQLHVTRTLISIGAPFWRVSDARGLWTIGILVGAALLLGAWNWMFYDANKTSMLSFYRDRLSRAYLFSWKPGMADPDEDPSSNAKDKYDVLKLSELGTRGPYHIVNTTLNLQGKMDLNLRGRRSENFILSKHYCGSRATGYIPTRELEDVDPELNLGTAMAISAAAASPNMGMTTIKPLTMLMTLLNVRLGYWLKNPRVWSDQWVAPPPPEGTVTSAEGDPKGGGAPPAPVQKERGLSKKTKEWLGQRVGVVYLFNEMLSGPNADRTFVQLSDGGHLENTGIYELLRRKCDFIIACDAEADPGYEFPSLARLIRFARIDWGIDIDIDLTDLRAHDNGIAVKSWAIGRIQYGRDDDGSEKMGYLLYIKASLTGNENEYIETYRQRNPTFPHQTTGDQFFDEAQFECYRALGYKVVSSLCDYADPEKSIRGCGSAFKWAEDLELPLRPRGNLDEELAGVQDELIALEEKFQDPSVYAYTKQIYPELEAVIHAPPDLYKIFWLAVHQLNFMENIFVQLQLDKMHQREHHFNRGWMNLFRRWAGSRYFAEAWVIAIGDYSVGFERFCRDVLGMGREVRLLDPVQLREAEDRAEAERFLTADLQEALERCLETEHPTSETRILIAEANVPADGPPEGSHHLTTGFPVGFIVLECNTAIYYVVSERYRQMYYLREMFEALEKTIPGVEVRLAATEESTRAAVTHFFDRIGIPVR